MAGPLDFNSIPIAKLKDVDISIEVQGRTQGRRFTIKYEDSEKKVVFHELYKNAQSLLRNHENLSEKDIKDIHAFVGKLKSVEQEAKVQYKQGTAGYRFLTFIHRLFGGSFTGTHLKRLTKLEGKLDKLAKPKLLEYIGNNTENFDNYFSSPFEVKSGDRTFVVEWQRNGKEFLIWDKDNGSYGEATHIRSDHAPDEIRKFKGILNHAVSIFNEIDIELTKRVNEGDVNSVKREEVVQLYKKIYDLSPKHPILSEPVVLEGKTYSIAITNDRFSDSVHISIGSFESFMPMKLQLTQESAQYGPRDSFSNQISVIPGSHAPVLDELQRRVADRLDEIEAECNQINEEVRNRSEAFRALRLLDSHDPALSEPIVVDGVSYAVSCSLSIYSKYMTIQKEPINESEGLLRVEPDDLSLEYSRRGTIPEDLLPVCNALYARIASRENEIRLQNEKRDEVVLLYERLYGLMKDHPALSDPIEVDGKTYSVKFSKHYLTSNPTIEIQEQGYAGFDRHLRIENGLTSYEYTKRTIPADFMPVLEQLQRRVVERWDLIEQDRELFRQASVRSAEFIRVCNPLFPLDPIFSRQIEVDGVSYSFERTNSGLKIMGNGEVLELSERRVKYNGRSSVIPPHFAAVMDEFRVEVGHRVNEINRQNDQRDEFIKAYKGLLRENPTDPIFSEEFVHEGKTYFLEQHGSTILLKNREDQSNLSIDFRTRLPENYLPMFNEICAKYADRVKEVEPIIKQREGLLDLYKSLKSLNPDLEIFKDPIVVDGKTYKVIHGAKELTVQEQGDGGKLTLKRGETQYGTKTMLTPEHMRPVLDEIARQMQVRLDEFEMAEMAALDVIFDDPELLDQAISLLKKEGVNFPGSVAVSKKDGALYLQDKKYAGTEQGIVQFGSDNSIIAEESKENTKLLLKKALFSASLHASAYDGERITLLRESVNYLPIWHLNMLTTAPDNFIITYRGEVGIDAGGLTRDYVGNLSTAISNQKNLFQAVEGALKLPRIVRSSEKGVVHCNAKESEAYQSLGQLLSRCYSSDADADQYFDFKLITTGRLFSDSLFKAALTLSEDELRSPTASREAELGMSKAILEYLDGEGSAETIKNMIKCIELLEPGKLESSLDQPVVSDDLKMALFLIGEDDGEPYMDDDFDPDMEKIKADIDGFKAVLFQAIMTSKAVDELNGVPLGSMLDPIYQIAKGMQAKLPTWEFERGLLAADMSSKIQGSIDREEIANSIMVDVDDPNGAPVLDQKVLWLKEWLNDEASDEEVKTFLKFATGSTSLAKDVKIKVDPQAINQPLMASSTCNRSLHMSNVNHYGGGLREEFWDDTKDKFIRNLKKVMAEDSFQTG